MSDIITSDTLKTWLNDKQEIALFDIREAGQFGEGHLFFAVPLPYSRLEIDIVRLAPRKDVRVVLVDEGDGLASSAARRLAALGYISVFLLEQGVHGWRAAGHTLFKGVNVPSKTFGELVEHVYETPHIGAARLQEWREQGKKFALLDGRTVEEHGKMTIPGSVSCPNGELGYRVATLVADEDTTIVINCAGRTRSILGAQTLRNLGLPNPVVALENGTQGWYLAGLPLEYGSTRRYSETAPGDIARERKAAAALIERFAIPVLDARRAQAWIDDGERTTFVFDIRTQDEFNEKTLPGALHAAGGQLIQASDQYVGVRNCRLILLDHEQVRAPIIASWLHQLGYEVALAEQGINAPLRLAVSSWSPAPPSVIDAEQLRALLDAADRPAVFDLRSSSAYRKAHAVGAKWLIRPRIAGTLAAFSTLPLSVVLVADSADMAALAALDLGDAGITRIFLAAQGLQTLAEAGFSSTSTPDEPDDVNRIDYLFFVHDRHEGNHEAARQYLAWETALIGQCTADELACFKFENA
jgi:rhodanese-related sulfurtransferase